MDGDNIKKQFDDTLKQLETNRDAMSVAMTPGEISRLERETQKIMWNLNHFTGLLGWWVKSVADKRRKELREKTVEQEVISIPTVRVVDTPSDTPVKKTTKKRNKKITKKEKKNVDTKEEK